MDRELLAQLRAELDRLDKREYELKQELFHVRAAAETKRKLIHDICKLRPVAAINRLPVEVLKQLFAGVSHRWRNIILNSPSLWTTICVCPTWPFSLVEMHVERSGEYPLDIAIVEWWDEDDDDDNTFNFLDPVLPYTHRWRSLTAHAGVPLTQFLRDFDRLFFPCLKSINIHGYDVFDFEFPAADNAPVLERLVLNRCRPAVTLLPSLERLTTLALKGAIGHWELRPRSIHLPLLRSLTVDVDSPRMLLQAIVVPGLSHFEATLSDVDSPFSDIPLFNEVHHLCLHASITCSVAEVCQAFPNVRHLEVGKLASKFFHGLQENTDLWSDLECVTFHSLHVTFLEEAVTEFREWLRVRKPTVKPLHVRFTRLKRRTGWKKRGKGLLSMLYNSLHENCTFEIDQFPLVERGKVTLLNHKLHLDLPHVPPCIVNMHSGQDIPWRESMDDFQNVSEDESIAITEDYIDSGDEESD
ncbi:hypothetical protein EDC04DRAFT_2908345 [Pisolithus marmoratus]|nr:hypothetical protein EDC04DRAFT_2908345 [Pisolithus marmoratus]